MGSSLTGQQIKNTYKSLIKTSDSTEASATAKLLSDGNGNDFGVYIDTDGVFGIGSAPSYSLDVSSRTDGVALPVGTTANRPTPTNGLLRYNSTIGKIEFYDGGWKTVFTTSGGTISGDVIITGDLTVQGDNTIIEAQTVEVEDNILNLNRTQGNPDTATATTSGISVYRGDGITEASFIFDDADDTWDLTNSLVVANTLQATTLTDGTATLTGGVLSNVTFADGVTAVTQATSDNSTKIATTAYVKSVVTLEDLDFAGDSGTGSVDLDSQSLTISGTTNEIETSASGQTITIGLPNNVVITGDLTVDTNTLYVDSANNRVGIGLTPSTKLDVDGIIKSNDEIQIHGTPSDSIGAGPNLYFNGGTGSSYTQLSQGVGRFTIWGFNGSSWGEKMTIRHSDGNVGINTTSPIAYSNRTTLAIEDAWGGVLDIMVSGVSHAQFGTDNFSSGLSCRVESKDGIVFKPSNTERLRIDSDGVTTLTAEGYQLAIKDESSGNISEILTSNTAMGFFADRANAVASTSMIFSIDNDTKMTIDSSGRVGIGLTPYTTSSLLNLKGNGLAIKNDLNGGSNNWSLIQNLASTTESSIDFTSGQGLAMTIAHNKNVGIGTASPAAALHATSSVSGGYGGIIYNTSATGEGLTVRGGSTSSQNALVVQDYNGANALFTVQGNGNVGIGTTFTSAKLQIENTSAGASEVALFLNNKSTSLNTETRLAFAANTNNDIANNRYSYISALNTSGSNGQALIFATNEAGAAAVERMRIDSSGRVGIGTDSPGSVFQVKTGTDNNIAFNVISGGTLDGIQRITSYNDAITSGVPLAINGLDLYFTTGTNNTERMRIDSSGTVIVKNATTSGANIQLQSDNGTWTQNDVISNLNTYISDTSGSGARDVAAIKVINEQAGVNTTTSGAMAFYTSPYNGSVTEQMRILSGGGLTFNGDTAAANALDDYEEGTWTATFAGSSTTATGYYTKIGNMVHIQVYGDSINVTSSTFAVIGGLPFTVKSGTYAPISTSHNTYTSTAIENGYAINNSTSINLMLQNSITAASTSTGTRFLMLAGTYQTS